MRRTILADDLTGETTDDVDTILFGIDGVRYEIDLTDANATELRKAMTPYVSAGRRLGYVPNRQASLRASSKGRNAEIREWARANGHKVPDRGRIPADVVSAWEQR